MVASEHPQPAPIRQPPPGELEAAVFDLDGVVTQTARVHFAAWKELFDAFLQRRARAGEDHRPFEPADYLAHVDGKPRLEGIAAFLASRGIALPPGSLDDPPSAETIGALGRRKNQIFLDLVDRVGVDVDPASVKLVRDLRAAGVRVGVATSSRNASNLLARARLADLFEVQVDGALSAELGLRGKPAPDIFLECLRRLGKGRPDRAMVVEDASSGVAAGKAGGFGLVLGIDRGDNWLRLREAGADWILRDMAEPTLDALAAHLAGRCHRRPNALAAWPHIADRLRASPLAIVLDEPLGPLCVPPELPVIAAHDGSALSRLRETAAQRGALPVYLGTDEPTFTALARRGLGILVGSIPRPTAAHYSLQCPFEVQLFLERVAALGRVH